MAAPSAWIWHDKAKEKMANNGIDLDGDSFEVRLYSSASDIGDTSKNDASTITNEISGNGYSGGIASTGSVSESNGTVVIQFTDVSWNSIGAGITARYAAIIDTTTTPDEIIAHCLCDSTPADVTAPASRQFTVQFHSQGALLLI